MRSDIEVHKGDGFLNEEDAIQITDAIRHGVNLTCALVFKAYKGQAHKVLKYDTWREYIITEFSMSASRSYQLIHQARTIQSLERLVPLGTEVLVTEKQARDIKPVTKEVIEEIEERTRFSSPEEAAEIIQEVIEDTRARLLEEKEEQERKKKALAEQAEQKEVEDDGQNEEQDSEQNENDLQTTNDNQETKTPELEIVSLNYNSELFDHQYQYPINKIDPSNTSIIDEITKNHEIILPSQPKNSEKNDYQGAVVGSGDPNYQSKPLNNPKIAKNAPFETDENSQQPVEKEPSHIPNKGYYDDNDSKTALEKDDTTISDTSGKKNANTQLFLKSLSSINDMPDPESFAINVPGHMVAPLKAQANLALTWIEELLEYWEGQKQ